MNKSFRIKTEVGDNANKHIKLKLEQEIDEFEILSLKIDQEDVYQTFNCNHGVLVGRVLGNGAVGIPNAKVSIFIPLSEEDEDNDEIRTAYPYKTPRDKNADGKRYNLLPRVGKKNPDTGTFSPKQPFGSLPIKEEFLANDTLLEVYEKYYKYSTVTNKSGDYMLFGVPTGVQTVHMSVDITDIGRFSMSPQTLVTNLGFSPNLFTDNGSRIKESSDLDDLPNIETQEISVDIIPFCGDEENFDIGITRQDFRIRAELVNTFVVFGSSFTMKQDNWWGGLEDGQRGSGHFIIRQESVGDSDPDLYGINNSPNTFRNGSLNERILYLPSDITDNNADNYNFSETDLLVLDRNSYSRTVRRGEFAYVIPCNRKKIITSETGEDIEVPADSPDGVFTEFRGIFLAELTEEELPIDDFSEEGMTNERTYRAKLRIPQAFHTNRYPNSVVSGEVPIEYLGKHKVFQGNKFYSVTQFIHAEAPNDETNDVQFTIANKISGNMLVTRYTNHIVHFGDDQLKFNATLIDGNGIDWAIFAAEWLNLCLYFPQYATTLDTSAGKNPETNDVVAISYFEDANEAFLPYHRPLENDQPLGAGLINTQGYIRADRHFTDFIELPVTDINNIISANRKGFRYSDNDLSGNKEQTAIPNNVDLGRDKPAGTLSQIGFDFDNFKYKVNSNNDPYFYQGVGNVNCVKLLQELGLV